MIGGLLRFAPGRLGAPRPRALMPRDSVAGRVVDAMRDSGDALETKPARRRARRLVWPGWQPEARNGGAMHQPGPGREGALQGGWAVYTVGRFAR